VKSFTGRFNSEGTRMNVNAKSFKRPALAVAVIALYAAAGSAPVMAQSEHCSDLYSRVMALYQADPYSPEYSRISGYYNSRCLANGPSAGAAYPGSYQTPYPAYQQPVAIFPGVSIVGRGYSGDDDYDYRSDRDRRY